MASPGPDQRPCPYCGNWNLPEYAFCGTCGKQLPPRAAPAPPESSPAPPTLARAVNPAIDLAAVKERSLAGAERIRLDKALTTGRAASLRGASVAFSALTLAVVGVAFLGALTDAWTYLLAVIALGMTAAAVGSAARRERDPLQRAVASDRAFELRGVPEIGPAEGKGTRVDLGGTPLLLAADQVARLRPDRMNRVTLADGGPGLGADRKEGWRVAVVLEWNGESEVVERCHVADANGGSP